MSEMAEVPQADLYARCPNGHPWRETAPFPELSAGCPYCDARQARRELLRERTARREAEEALETVRSSARFQIENVESVRNALLSSLIAAVEEHEAEKRKAHIWRDLEDMARWHQEIDSKLWRSKGES